MIYMHFNSGIESERRMLRFADNGGINNMPKASLDDTINLDGYKNWRKKTPGAKELFDSFADRTDVTIQDLDTYMADKQMKGTQLQPFDMHLLQHLNEMHKEDPLQEPGEEEEGYIKRRDNVMKE